EISTYLKSSRSVGAGQERRAGLDCEAAGTGQGLEDEDRVRDRRVLEVRLARLERRKHLPDGSVVRSGVTARKRRNRPGHGGRKVRARLERGRLRSGELVLAGGEEGERRRVAADRRGGGGGPLLERPARILGGSSLVASEEARLDRADQAAPALGRRRGEARAVALGGAGEPARCLGAPPEHQTPE